MRRWLALLLLAAGAVAPAAAGEELLEPDKAFRFSARALDAGTLEVRYRIADGYYLYRDKFAFAAEPAEVKLGAPQFPPGRIHTDQFFGRVETYRGDLRILIPLEDAGGAQRLRLTATSQGCADAGVCYVPHDQVAEVRLAGASGWFGAGAGPSLPEGLAKAAPGYSLWSSDTAIASMLESRGFWFVLAGFFGFGLLLTFTPCVLPMVPILSGIIAGEGKDIDKLRALSLSLAYVLGMAIAYALAGIAAAYTGSMFAAALQNPWVLSGFAAIFVWLALSMFGYYEIRLPAFLHHRLSRAHQKLRGGKIASVAAMGMLSAVIVSPCAAAPLAGALLYISQTQDVALGGAALFVMALGMGVPLVVVGVSEGALLPKAGAWMRAVKNFFGVLLLAVAIWVISPVVPEAFAMLLWAALLIVSAVFLRAVDPLAHDAPGYARLGKGLGLIALVAGIVLVIGALAGGRDPLRPLAGLRASAPGAPAAAPLRFERVATLAELDRRLASPGRPVMLDFYAEWCVTCKEMERDTFGDPRVRAALADMLLLQVDVTASTEQDKALLRRFRLFGPPGIVFFDSSGSEIPGVRVIGYQNAERFLATLRLARAREGGLAGSPTLPYPAGKEGGI